MICIGMRWRASLSPPRSLAPHVYRMRVAWMFSRIKASHAVEEEWSRRASTRGVPACRGEDGATVRPERRTEAMASPRSHLPSPVHTSRSHLPSAAAPHRHRALSAREGTRRAPDRVRASVPCMRRRLLAVHAVERSAVHVAGGERLACAAMPALPPPAPAPLTPPPPARMRPRPQRSGRAPRSVAAASRSPPAWLAEELCGARLPERVSPSASPVGRPLEEQESARACTHSGADLGAHAPTWAPT